VKTFSTAPAPHWQPARSVQQVMGEVCLALIPLLAVQTWFYGVGVLIQVALATGSFWLVEYLALTLRGRPSAAFLRDLSAPLAGILFALCLPPWAPWYVSVVAAFFAIGVAKHLFGGLGYNPFNPAMVGYAVVLISFSAALARYPASDAAGLDLLTLCKVIFLGAEPKAGFDALSAATPLDLIDQAKRAGLSYAELKLDASYDAQAPFAIALAALLGGLFIVWRRHAAWQVPVGVVLGVVAFGGPLWLWLPDQLPSPIEQMFLGSLMLGAFFIATDPVSGAATPRGRLLFGFGVGALTIAIRQFGAYPEGVAFAVLLMNTAAPLLDRLTQSRVFGR